LVKEVKTILGSNYTIEVTKESKLVTIKRIPKKEAPPPKETMEIPVAQAAPVAPSVPTADAI
jgi:hypothetical protein